MRKTKVAMILAASLLLTATAQAEAPTSQFGFSGWPYRQQTDCSADGALMGGDATACPGGATQAPSTASPLPSQPTEAPILPTRTPDAPTAQPAPVTPVPTVAATAAPVPTRAPSMDDDYTTDSIAAQEQKAINLLNSERMAQGLPALTVDPELTRLARLKSQDMRDNRYFAHESPTYGRVSDLLTRFGYAFSGAGENIAHHATVDKAHAAFMSSEGHRRNILSSAWTKVGIGVCYDASGYVYETQIFVR